MSVTYRMSNREAGATVYATPDGPRAEVFGAADRLGLDDLKELIRVLNHAHRTLAEQQRTYDHKRSLALREGR